MPEPTIAAAPELIERDDALAAIASCLAAAADGTGAALLVEGPPGLGKSQLLAGAALRAVRLGMTVRSALGGELEQSFGWGIARELLGSPARAAADRVSPVCAAALGLGGIAVAADPVDVAHSLTDLCAELSAVAPMALIVDDAHWADPLSVRWLAYLAPRVRELPVALIVAARPHDPRRPSELTMLAARDGVNVTRLAPLTAAGAAVLVRRSIRHADDELCAECHRVTSGNAFMLAELVRELGAAHSSPTVADIAAVSIDRIDRVIARRLSAAGAEAEALARAASLFTVGPRLADVAAVAELSMEAAHRAADALRAADVLSGDGRDELEFTHPLVRSTVRRAIAPGQRSLLHLRAARQLAGDDRLEQVAAHLLAAEAGDEPWVRAQLVEAGDRALASGAPRNAVILYERAAAERLGARDPQLLAKLGRAAMRIEPAAAEGPLASALEVTLDPLEKVPIALDLAIVLQTLRRPAEAVPILDNLSAQLRRIHAPRRLQLRVQAELLAQAFFGPDTRRLGRARLAELAGTLHGEDDEEALIVIHQAVAAINSGTAVQARALAEGAWLNGRLPELAGSQITPAVMWIPYIRMYVDDYDWTMRLMLEWLESARQAGSAVLTAFANGILSEAQWRAGALRDAHASALAAWQVAAELGSSFPPWWIAIGALCQTLLAVGRAAEAADLMRDQGLLDGAPPDIMLLPLPRAVRAEVLVANGQLDSGVTELLSTRAWVDRQQEPSPGAWRFYATLVDGLIGLGRRDEAGDVAREWLRRTRHFGTLSTRGMAERAVALCATGDTQLSGLRQAEHTLAASPAHVEHARALLELGAALRRARHRAEAREPLRRALDLATRCGAVPLAERARVELLASGGRPRRPVLSGADALTASERRIAQMAGSGLTNREIASALFISRKTVERHLTNVYLKLGTNDRRSLPATLALTVE